MRENPVETALGICETWQNPYIIGLFLGCRAMYYPVNLPGHMAGGLFRDKTARITRTGNKEIVR